MHSRLRCLVFPFSVTALLVARNACSDVLRTAEAVRSLPREEAAKGLPIRISGVVTFIQTGMAIVVQDGTEGVREFEANHLLLLAQEALTNALKHASPSAISIEAKIDSENLLVTVKDDGIGFDPELAPGPRDGHFGLLGMRERVHALIGHLAIISAPHQGTCVEVTIPLDSQPSPV